jgi:tetratricopeptide (TPR) repeat protein
MHNKLLMPALLLGLAAGCAMPTKKPTPTEAATRQWNSARAGVMATLGKDQYESGNFEKARLSFNEAIKLDSENAMIRVLSARLAVEQGQFELAEKELRLARQFDPRNAEADYLSGVVYQRWQKPELAYEFYSHASEKSPADISYLMAKTEMLVSMDKAPDALAMLQEKVVYFEHSAAIRDSVGQLLVGQKQYAAAVAMLSQASVLTPDDLTIKEHLGLALFYAKEYDEASTALARLVKDEHYANRADLHATIGECLCNLGKFREAREAFEIATKIDPGSAGLWLGLGKSALQYGDLRRAELALKKAISIDPASTEANFLTGYLRLRQDRLPEALAAFQKAGGANSADPLSLCMTGYVLEKLGRSDEAIQCYGNALKRDPNDELASKLMAGIQLHE